MPAVGRLVIVNMATATRQQRQPFRRVGPELASYERSNGTTPGTEAPTSGLAPTSDVVCRPEVAGLFTRQSEGGDWDSAP